jgi:uncharacterized lipoprotein YmbA
MIQRYFLLSLLVLAALQTACSLGGPSKPSKFYVLSASPASPVAGRESADVPLAVAVGPVELPDIFDRPQIVTRPGANRIDLAEFNRWGGDLNADLSRVLVQNLMVRLNTQNVSAYPLLRDARADFRVAVRFFRFDGELGKRVNLSGTWQLLDGESGCPLATRGFDISEMPAGPTYDDFVQAISDGVAKLSQAIAVTIAAAKPGCG